LNYFKSAGFDEIDVISEMNITEKSGNSIEIIEKYIQRKYTTSKDHNPFPGTMAFEFPPGHRIRICHFVKEVRKLKRSLDCTNSNPNLKRTSESACTEKDA